MNEIMIIDTETGGLNPTKNALCSITVKMLNNDKIKTIYIKPQSGLVYDEHAMQINGLTLDMLEEHGVSEQQAARLILEFMKNNPVQDRYGNTIRTKPSLLGHNIMFDIGFMNALFQRVYQCDFMSYVHYHSQCTMMLMKMLRDARIVNIRNIGLMDCYLYFFKEKFNGAHTSESDVLATEKVYNAMIAFLTKRV